MRDARGFKRQRIALYYLIRGDGIDVERHLFSITTEMTVVQRQKNTNGYV